MFFFKIKLFFFHRCIFVFFKDICFFLQQCKKKKRMTCDIDPLLTFNVFGSSIIVDDNEETTFHLNESCSQIVDPFSQYCLIPPSSRLEATQTCSTIEQQRLNPNYIFSRITQGLIQTLPDLPILYVSFPEEKGDQASNIWIRNDELYPPNRVIDFSLMQYNGFRPVGAANKIRGLAVSDVRFGVFLMLFESFDDPNQLQLYKLDPFGFFRPQYDSEQRKLQVSYSSTSIFKPFVACNAAGTIQCALLAGIAFKFNFNTKYWDLLSEKTNLKNLIVYEDFIILTASDSIGFITPRVINVILTGDFVWQCLDRNGIYLFVGTVLNLSNFVHVIDLSTQVLTAVISIPLITTFSPNRFYSAINVASDIEGTTIIYVTENNTTPLQQFTLIDFTSGTQTTIFPFRFVEEFYNNKVWFENNELHFNNQTTFATTEGVNAFTTFVTPNTSLASNTNDTWAFAEGLLQRFRPNTFQSAVSQKNERDGRGVGSVGGVGGVGMGGGMRGVGMGGAGNIVRASNWTSNFNLYMPYEAHINDLSSVEGWHFPPSGSPPWYYGYTSIRFVQEQFTNFPVEFATSRHNIYRWIVDGVTSENKTQFPHLNSYLTRINDYYLIQTVNLFKTNVSDDANVIITDQSDNIVFETNTHDQASNPFEKQIWKDFETPLITSNGLYIGYLNNQNGTNQFVICYNVFNSYQFAQWCGSQGSEFRARALEQQRTFCYRNLQKKNTNLDFVDARCACIPAQELFEDMFPGSFENNVGLVSTRMVQNIPCLSQRCASVFLHGPESTNAFLYAASQCDRQNFNGCIGLVELQGKVNLPEYTILQNCGIGFKCNTNKECPTNSICFNGDCVPACHSNPDCVLRLGDPLATCDANTGICLYHITNTNEKIKQQQDTAKTTWIIIIIVCVILIIIFIVLTVAFVVDEPRKRKK